MPQPVMVKNNFGDEWSTDDLLRARHLVCEKAGSRIYFSFNPGVIEADAAYQQFIFQNPQFQHRTNSRLPPRLATFDETEIFKKQCTAEMHRRRPSIAHPAVAEDKEQQRSQKIAHFQRVVDSGALKAHADSVHLITSIRPPLSEQAQQTQEIVTLKQQVKEQGAQIEQQTQRMQQQDKEISDLKKTITSYNQN